MRTLLLCADMEGGVDIAQGYNIGHQRAYAKRQDTIGCIDEPARPYDMHVRLRSNAYQNRNLVLPHATCLLNVLILLTYLNFKISADTNEGWECHTREGTNILRTHNKCRCWYCTPIC